MPPTVVDQFEVVAALCRQRSWISLRIVAALCRQRSWISLRIVAALGRHRWRGKPAATSQTVLLPRPQFDVAAALCRRRWRAKPAFTSQTDFMKASAPSSKTDKTLPWTGTAVKDARRAFILTLGSPPRRLRL